MSLDKLFRCLASRSVELYLADGCLRYRAPEGALNMDLRNQIAARRLEIIEHLRSATTAAGGPQRCGNCDRRNWVDEPAKGGRIRTTCGKCGRFIGYRPVGPRMA